MLKIAWEYRTCSYLWKFWVSQKYIGQTHSRICKSLWTISFADFLQVGGRLCIDHPKWRIQLLWTGFLVNEIYWSYFTQRITHLIHIIKYFSWCAASQVQTFDNWSVRLKPIYMFFTVKLFYLFLQNNNNNNKLIKKQLLVEFSVFIHTFL